MRRVRAEFAGLHPTLAAKVLLLMAGMGGLYAYLLFLIWCAS